MSFPTYRKQSLTSSDDFVSFWMTQLSLIVRSYRSPSSKIWPANVNFIYVFLPKSCLNDMIYLCRVQPNWRILGKSKTVITYCACSDQRTRRKPRATDTGKSRLRLKPPWIFLYTLIEIVVLKSPKQVGETIYVLKHPSTEKSRQLTYPTQEDSE